MPGNEPTVTVPSRSRRYGIGKEIGGSVYVHRQYEEVLGAAVASAKRSLPSDFKYHVVKFNHRTQTVSFIQCPRFDHDPEPAIAAAIIVRPDGTKRLRGFRADDPPIYHHKWLFVADDYSGFDIEESKRRSAVLRQDERCSKVLVPLSDFGRSGKRILGKGMIFSRHSGIVWPQPP
jgi:hypothetical protein